MNYGGFVSNIRKAYQHTGGIKTLRLGKLSDEWFRQIQSDCARIIETSGSSDVTEKTHVTNWTRPTGQVRQFSLFNETGNTADTKGDYGYLGDVKRKRLVYPELQGLRRFASLFQPALRNLRLNGMGLKSALNAHEEGSIHISGFRRNYICRFHLPVFSNKNAFVYLDGERHQYEEGFLYFFNHGCVHAASNEGAELRYHLVLDCFLDRRLFDRVFPGSRSRFPGFDKSDDLSAKQKGEPFHFPDFVQENGRILTGPIAYGRRIPGRLDNYRRDYPSVFGRFSKKATP